MFRILEKMKKPKNKFKFNTIYTQKEITLDLAKYDEETKNSIIKFISEITSKSNYSYREFVELYNKMPEYLNSDLEDFYKTQIETLFQGSIYLTDCFSKYKELHLKDICKENEKVLIIGTGTNSKIQTLKSISNFGNSEFLVIQNYNNNFDANVNIYKNPEIPDAVSINVILKNDEVLINKLANSLSEKELNKNNIKKALSENDLDYIVDIDDILIQKNKVELVDIINEVKDILVYSKKDILKNLFSQLLKCGSEFKIECIKNGSLIIIDESILDKDDKKNIELENIENNTDEFPDENSELENENIEENKEIEQIEEENTEEENKKNTLDELDEFVCLNVIIPRITNLEQLQISLNNIITSNLSFKSLTPLIEELNIFIKSNEKITYKTKYGNAIDNQTEFINDILYDYKVVLTHSPNGIIDAEFDKFIKILIETGRINNTKIVVDEDIIPTIKTMISRLPEFNSSNIIDVDYKVESIKNNIIQVENFRKVPLNFSESKTELEKLSFNIPISKIVFYSLYYQNTFINNYEMKINSMDSEKIIDIHKNTNILKTSLIEEFSKLFFTTINNQILNSIKKQETKISLEKVIYVEKDYLKDFLIKIEEELTDKTIDKLNNDIIKIVKSLNSDYRSEILNTVKSTVNLDNQDINFYTIFIKTLQKSDILTDLNINFIVEE